jgi:hypothetical protein
LPRMHKSPLSNWTEWLETRFGSQRQSICIQARLLCPMPSIWKIALPAFYISVVLAEFQLSIKITSGLEKNI